MSRVVVCTRTLNEIDHIQRFLDGYDWADKILIADGGSEDGTVEVARCADKVEVRSFTERIYDGTGFWRNPEGRHVNFLLDWAEKEEHPDWIIVDDADSAPTRVLSNAGRRVFESCRYDTVWTFRMYVWGTEQWFPELTGGSLLPTPKWSSIWAWRPGLLRWKENDPWYDSTDNSRLEGKSKALLRYPCALLHFFYLNEGYVERKMARYNRKGRSLEHPLKSCGRLEELPSWAKLT